MEQSYAWVLSCIESSTNGFQFRCCKTLIELFKQKYAKEPLGELKAKELLSILDAQDVRFRVGI